MIQYPETCALLTEEELEYTTGGMNGLVLGGWLLVGVRSVVAFAYDSSLSDQLRKENPGKYNSSKESRTQFSKDVRQEYFRHPAGWLTVVGYVAGAAAVFLGGMQEGAASVPPVTIPSGTEIKF